MKCAHCIHSIGSVKGLWCGLFKRIAIHPCRVWMREPGSDDE